MASPLRARWAPCRAAARTALLAGALLALPGIGGPAGLTFLQGFTRWSGERRPDGAWQFVLEAA